MLFLSALIVVVKLANAYNLDTTHPIIYVSAQNKLTYFGYSLFLRPKTSCDDSWYVWCITSIVCCSLKWKCGNFWPGLFRLDLHEEIFPTAKSNLPGLYTVASCTDLASIFQLMSLTTSTGQLITGKGIKKIEMMLGLVCRWMQRRTILAKFLWYHLKDECNFFKKDVALIVFRFVGLRSSLDKQGPGKSWKDSSVVPCFRCLLLGSKLSLRRWYDDCETVAFG